MLNSAEHEKKFYNLRSRITLAQNSSAEVYFLSS